MPRLTGSAATIGDDCVFPFQIDKIGVRGRLVRLGPVIDELLRRHDYPQPVSYLLGELIVLSVALASALKFDGVFALEVRGDGPVKAMVADVQTPGAIRAYASFEEAAFDPESRAPADVRSLLGKGVLTWTVDQGPDTERYQGIVALEGATLAECAENYFRRSEQLRAAIRVGVGQEANREGVWQWRAGAIMVQNLAAAGGFNRPKSADIVAEEGDWQHAKALVGTARDTELIDSRLSAERILRRLFHEDGVWVYDSSPLEASCRCSRERIESVLHQFSPAEIREMVQDDGEIEVRCEFCNERYSFLGEDILAQGAARRPN